MQVTPELKAKWLSLARQTIAADVRGERRGAPQTSTPSAGLCGGLFVSLYLGRRLRGCIGTFSPAATVEETIIEMAGAALLDPRFAEVPVNPGDLPRLKVEISLLSAPQRTLAPAELTPGVHGIRISREGRAGCFLPQVATTAHWSAEEFLAQCCEMKAGLPRDAWRDPETIVELFTAERISE